MTQTMLTIVHDALVAQCERAGRRPLVAGLCGAQGSGKSTLTSALADRLAQAGLRTATLSLDDLYHGTEARREFAGTIHPLLAVRGVPGTHDVDLGLSAIGRIRRGEPACLPRFDKASDMPRPRGDWPVAGPVDILLFEGWCVGAAEQNPCLLAEPVNRLEAEHDRDGAWRGYVNEALRTRYRSLFDEIDFQIFLAAPSMAVVTKWRQQQEHELRARLEAEGRSLGRTMDDSQIAEFVQYYERITRHLLIEMPDRADLTIFLDEARSMSHVWSRRAGCGRHCA